MIQAVQPQPRQAIFLASPADIVIFGGAAGGGKTFALLMEALRHQAVAGFGAVIFRRTVPELMKQGGIWDEAGRMFPLLGARPNENRHEYIFRSGARIGFGSLQYEADVQDWRSSQIALLAFDQLETFTQQQFFYMLSRNRSTCGVQPYVRATCNPEPGWLADFLSWWIADDGYAILDRVGRVRWMVRVRDDLLDWADTPQELQRRHPGALPKSVTFIVSTVYDNDVLLRTDPGYLANLQALPLVDRERLLGDAKRGGNWKIKPAAGKIFNRDWFEIVDAVPAGCGQAVRFWDLAATEKSVKSPDPDYTASEKMCLAPDGTVYVLDATADRLGPAQADLKLVNTATQDGRGTIIRFEMERGASGKRDARYITRLLRGYDVAPVPPRGDKVTRSKPFAAQALAGNVKLLRGDWNDAWLAQHHGFPDGPHDDLVDCSSGAYGEALKIPERTGRSFER